MPRGFPRCTNLLTNPSHGTDGRSNIADFLPPSLAVLILRASRRGSRQCPCTGTPVPGRRIPPPSYWKAGKDHPLHSVNRRKQAFADKYRSLKNDLDHMNEEYRLPMSRVPDDHKPLRGKVGVPGKKRVSILDGPIQEEDKSETILQLKVRKLQNNVKTTEGKFDDLVDEYNCNRKDIRMRANKPKPRSMAIVVYEDPA
ncbi:hypothetical protein Bbelb_210930 [Branchiostoma belcheri]|nr:hypothetical protein Bbelb_210930 [Branchiostoma belcheri]